jgi:hypothetical protein
MPSASGVDHVMSNHQGPQIHCELGVKCHDVTVISSTQLSYRRKLAVRKCFSFSVLVVLYSGGIHHSLRRRVAAPVTEAEGAVCVLRLLLLLYCRTVHGNRGEKRAFAWQPIGDGCCSE